jgi:transposase
VKLQLVMFFEGLRSERQLMAVASDRPSLRWYLGYDLGERLPNHSGLTKIRQRLGLETFERFFDRMVELCREAGLVWGRGLIFDATKVRANADLDSLVPRFYLERQAAATPRRSLRRGGRYGRATRLGGGDRRGGGRGSRG